MSAATHRHPEAAGLLRDILEHPHDDTPRLVYADWLEDAGEGARAEFIRVQIELAHHPEEVAWLQNMPVESWTGTDKVRKILVEADGLLRRERELLDANDFVDFPGYMIEWQFRRGFVERITLPMADYFKHAAELFGAHPIVEVRLSDRHAAAGRHGWHGWAAIPSIAGRSYWVFLKDMDRPVQEDHWLPLDFRDSVIAAGGEPLSEHESGGLNVVSFSTSDAAESALSRAAVAYGRAVAGLSILTYPAVPQQPDTAPR